MILQKIVWNFTGEYGPAEMFARGDAEALSDGCLGVSAGTRITFDTYFNLFSLAKWSKYTLAAAPEVSLTLWGSGEIFLMGTWADGREAVLDRVDYDAKETPVRLTLRIGAQSDAAYCYVGITARTDTRLLNGAWEEADGDAALRDIRLACCICTYHREEDVKRNVRKLDGAMREPDSPLAGRLEIFVVDNGHTLNGEDIPAHVITNPNYGGSAGFTRGMLEAVLYRRGGDCTHVLLMDDDVVVYPEVLIRTLGFLRMLREEYRDCILGGSMLLAERRGILAEGCGVYDPVSGHNLPDPRIGSNLTDRNALLRGPEPEANFSGWWYSCIPAGLIRDGNLPLPLFLHRDDQDYSVRSGRGILQLYGICVWHPSPSSKHADYIDFYDMRNMLIAAVDLCGEPFAARCLSRHVIAECIKKALGYHYLGAELLLEGCEAFLDGPEAFLAVDPEALHRELIGRSRKERREISPEELTDVKRVADEQYLSVAVKLFRYLKPDRRTCYAEAACNYPSYLGYRRVIYLDAEERTGYELQRSMRATLRLARRLMRVCRRMNRRLAAAWEEWGSALPRLKSWAFWETYLGLRP